MFLLSLIHFILEKGVNEENSAKFAEISLALISTDCFMQVNF